MTKNISISEKQIIYQLKISCQLPRVFKDILIHQIINETAQAKGVTIEANELQQMADNFRLQNNLLDTKTTFNWLKTHDLSTEDFEYLIHSQALATKLANFLFAEAAESHFYEHKLDYTKALIYEIVLPDFDLALEFFYGIQEREFSFWDLAHQYIEDIELRRRGGYRGFLTRDALKPEISAAVFAAQPPQILKPILVDKKAHLIYVEEIMQPELNETIRNQIIDYLFEKWLDKGVKNKLH